MPIVKKKIIPPQTYPLSKGARGYFDMKRFLFLIFIFSISSAAYLYLGTDLKSVPTNANATGGAFIYGKHGGNTNVDGGDGVVWCPAPHAG